MMFDAYLRRWGLRADGDAIVTRSSCLLPVIWRGAPAMLNVAVEAEEKAGAALMAWWDGNGAARVLALEGEALLMERAQCRRSLVEMSRTGRDDEATRIICDVLGRLHAPRTRPPPPLVALDDWFRDLEPAAAAHGGVLATCAATAAALLASQQDKVVLHGDIHHGNILDFGDRGWLAIDPKRLYGERGFDYANLFCNPDAEIATSPAHFLRRLQLVASVASLDPLRLLQWVLAWSGLSAAWFLAHRQSPEPSLGVARMAAARLEHLGRLRMAGTPT